MFDSKIEKQINKLKEKARYHYIAYKRIIDRNSCGKELTEYLSPAAAGHKADFNETMDEMCKLDPNCPNIGII